MKSCITSALLVFGLLTNACNQGAITLSTGSNTSNIEQSTLAVSFGEKTFDGWSMKMRKLGDESLTDVFFVNQKNGWLVGVSAKDYSLGRKYDVTASTLYKTVDGGDNWSRIELEPEKKSYFSKVFFTDENTGWLVVQKQTVPGRSEGISMLHTEDGGNTWDQIYEIDGIFVTGFVIDLEGKGWIVGSMEQAEGRTGIALFTQDKGHTWTNVYPNAINTSHRQMDVAVSDLIRIEAEKAFLLFENGSIVSVQSDGKKWVSHYLNGKGQHATVLKFVSQDDDVQLMTSILSNSGMFTSVERRADNISKHESKIDGLLAYDIVWDGNLVLLSGGSSSIVSMDDYTTELSQSAKVIYSLDKGRTWSLAFELPIAKRLVDARIPNQSPAVNNILDNITDSDRSVYFRKIVKVDRSKYLAVGDAGFVVTLTAPESN
ncbi:MAG: hypothetical protein KF855_17180 [Acidobacteria bacterium]|nr:hypothetical protein [Acidobacteriota bacterium]